VSSNADQADSRLFPRMDIRCPVLYRMEGSGRDLIGLAVDFSATGVKILCKDPVAVDCGIHIELKPGRNRAIPALAADGVVVRCEPYSRGGYWVSCHLRTFSRQPRP